MLEIRTVSKTFNPGTLNELRALQAVNLTVGDGSFVVIIGTNGSGKSTLLNAVAGSFYVDSGGIFLPARTSLSGPSTGAQSSSAAFFRIRSAARQPTCLLQKTLRLPRIAGDRAGWAGPCGNICSANCVIG